MELFIPVGDVNERKGGDEIERLSAQQLFIHTLGIRRGEGKGGRGDLCCNYRGRWWSSGRSF